MNTPKAKTPALKSVSKSSRKGFATKTPKSTRKVARPLWSEVVRKNLGKTPKKVSREIVKKTVVVGKKKSEKAKGKTPAKARKIQTSSTGHAQSPEAVVITKKVTRTPKVVTKKGRKSPVST